MDVRRVKGKFLLEESEAGTKNWQRHSLMPFAEIQKGVCEVDFGSDQRGLMQMEAIVKEM